ncbi:PrsW family intramembrane metalloprotease [bacterium]|nr:PrsW family intramembrane metalloprotease [bacterium]
MRKIAGWLVWVVLLGLALAMLELISYALQPGHLVQAIWMAALPAPFYIAAVLWFDRFEPEPPSILTLAFVLGACLATFVSLNVNEMSTASYLQSTKSVDAAEVLTVVLTAPIVEELCKASCLLLVFWLHRKEVDGTLDCVIYSTMVALGFAVFENIIYYGQALDHDRATFTFCMRGIVGAFCHPLFTSMTALGLGYALDNPRLGQRPWWALAPALTLAILLHAAWNFSAVMNPFLWAVLYLLVMVPAGMAVLTELVKALGRESGWIRRYLKGEISQARIDVVSSVSGRIRFSWSQLRRHGLPGWWHSERYLVLASRLAFLKHHRDQGDETQAEREEQLRLAMRQEEAWLNRQFARPD